MAQPKTIGIRERLNTLLPAAELERLARDTDLVRRRRKLEPAVMLWTLALGFGAGSERTLAALRRTYERVSGERLAASSFHARFTPALVRFLRAVLGVLGERVAETRRVDEGLLGKFSDIVAADASVIKLHRLLAERFAGTRTNSAPAAAKLHLVASVLGRRTTRVRLSGEREKDHRALRVGPWVRGRLLLFDLGFFRYQLFDCIERNGGFFLSRLPLSANPRIVALNDVWRGRTVELIGRRLDEVAARLRRAVLDVEVEVEFKRRAYRARRSKARRRLRLVGIRDAESGRYWFYLTNLPVERIEAEALAELYAARWQIELVFRQMKSHYALEQMPSRKAEVVEALMLASVITLMVGRELLEAVRARHRERARRVREERWAALFATVATSVLDVVLLPRSTAKALARRLEPMLLHEAIDPNEKRRGLLERVDSGTAWVG